MLPERRFANACPTKRSVCPQDSAILQTDALCESVHFVPARIPLGENLNNIGRALLRSDVNRHSRLLPAEKMLPLLFRKAFAAPGQSPSDRPKYRRLARPIHASENMGTAVRLTIAVRKVDVELLEGPDILGDQSHQRHRHQSTANARSSAAARRWSVAFGKDSAWTRDTNNELSAEPTPMPRHLHHREESVGLGLLATHSCHYGGVARGERHGTTTLSLEDSGLDQSGVGDCGRGASDGNRR